MKFDRRRALVDGLLIVFALVLLVAVAVWAVREYAWAQWIRLVIHLVPPGWLRAWLLGWL